MKLQPFKVYLLDNERDPQEYQSNPWTALNEGHKQELGLPQLW